MRGIETMKKFLIVLLVLFFVVALIRITTSTYENIKRSEIDETNTNIDIVEIPVDSVKGITQKEAEELCYYVMGEKDEDTGFLFSFGTSGAVEKDKKQYYVIRASWLVNNNHLSYIGDFFVSADGTEIYNGTSLANEYVISDKIWSKY